MTEATLNLDARQRAMLDEMGVKVWWPVTVLPPVTETVEVAIETIAAGAEPAGATARFDSNSAPTAAPVAPAPAPARRAPVPANAADAPAAPPRAAPRAGGATVWIEPARRLYAPEGAADASATGGWLIVADMPPQPDGRFGEPFEGDAGRLLDNMLRALQLEASGAPVHLARVHRGAAAPGGDEQPLDTGFAAQAEALAPRLVLALGPLAAQGLLHSPEPLGRLRGQLLRSALQPATPLVASYHPVFLLRNPADKAKAWADLCLAAAQFDDPVS